MKYYHIVIASLILLSSCGNSQPVNKSEQEVTADETTITLTAEQAKSADLQIGLPQTQLTEGVLYVNGVVELAPENIYTISVPLGGYVRTSRVVEGMFVSKGAILAAVEDMAYIQLQQDYLTAKSKVEFLSADYNRQKELHATQSNSQKTFQEAKAAYEEQKILLRALEEKLRLIGVTPLTLNEQNIHRTINILAPISGYISKVNVNPGKYVNSTDVLFELMSHSGHYLRLSVFEKDAGFLTAGQTLTYYSVADPQHLKKARISIINRNIDTDRTVEVRCVPLEANQNLIPGSFVNAEISINKRPAIVLPDEAVVSWQGRSYVFVQRGVNVYSMKLIETGQQANGFTEIKTPVKDSCVTKNAFTLLGMLKNKSDD